MYSLNTEFLRWLIVSEGINSGTLNSKFNPS